MTIEECYKQLGGDYSNVLSRLSNDAIIRKFLVKFLSDGSCGNIFTNLESGNLEEAFPLPGGKPACGHFPRLVLFHLSALPIERLKISIKGLLRVRQSFFVRLAKTACRLLQVTGGSFY